ncbi:MAG: NAD(P)-dependent oxidoreductase [Dongiaceae bacterium]
MRVVLVSDYEPDPEALRAALARRGPVALTVWPACGDPAEVEVILLDSPAALRGGYGAFPRLRWVGYLGHGAGDVLRDPSLPESVAVTRLKDPFIARGLGAYVVHAVLARHLRVEDYADLQRQAAWRRVEVPPTSERTVGVLGLGYIGRHAAHLLRDLGFRVLGWSDSAKTIEGVACSHGRPALAPLLARCDHVVAVLPETDRTVALFDAAAFAAMKPGAHLVNVGRGSLVVEADLVAALDSGRLSAASLDVFATEPLPADSPLWRHPRVTVTPHTGGGSNGSAHIEEVAENYGRLLAGRPLLNLADRAKGY